MKEQIEMEYLMNFVGFVLFISINFENELIFFGESCAHARIG
jgi:hypothetical protein